MTKAQLTEKVKVLVDELDVPYLNKQAEEEFVQSIVKFILSLNPARLNYEYSERVAAAVDNYRSKDKREEEDERDHARRVSPRGFGQSQEDVGEGR